MARCRRCAAPSSGPDRRATQLRLAEYVDRAEACGEAVVEAAMSRFRPIMLTAISTVLSMIPIAPTIFWGPKAYAILCGRLAVTVLTLIFLPALHVTWFRVKEKAANGPVAK
jgi:multidrug efflux pump subunit AcrB